MDSNLYTAITARGFAPVGNNIFCGTYKNIPLWISPAKKKSPAFTIGIAFLMTPPPQYLKAVQFRLSEIATVRLVIKNDSYAVSLGSFMCNIQAKDNTADFGFIFDTALQALIGEMNQAGLAIPAVCQICGLPNCDSFAYYKYYYRPVHANCVYAASQNAQAVEQKTKSKSYGTGAIGAVLGALVGSLPTILVLAFAGIISGWLCALIPFVSYLGYNMLGGKRTKLSVLFVILATIVMVPLVVYVTTAIEYYQLFNEVMSVYFFLIYLFEYGMVYFLQVLIFTGLGILFSIGSIIRSSKADSGIAPSAVSTLRPITNNISNTSAPPMVANVPQLTE